MTISDTGEFNDKSGANAANDKARELPRHDRAHAEQVLTGTLDTHEGTIAGRIPTGDIAMSENQRLLRTREKENTKRFIHAHEALRDILRQIDEQIAELSRRIADLQKRYQEAMQSSEEAFGKMHDLEAALEEIEQEGMTDTRRTKLKKLIGEEAENITDDALLLDLARRQAHEARSVGIDASSEADSIQRDIEGLIEKRDGLIKERDGILNDPNASPEEKAARLKESLNLSSIEQLSVSQSSDPDIEAANSAIHEQRDGLRSELSEADMLALDDDTPLDTAPPSILKP